jgi:hypothetical protein
MHELKCQQFLLLHPPPIDPVASMKKLDKIVLIGEDANALAKPRREPRGGTMLLERVQEPKVDGRKNNKGKCKRQRYSLLQKYKMIMITKDEDWKEENPGKTLTDYVAQYYDEDPLDNYWTCGSWMMKYGGLGD